MKTLAVLIPTVNRAERLARLVHNVHEATEAPHEVYLVGELEDEATRLAVEGLEATAILGDFGSCANAMNIGYELSAEPYVFTGNDDLKFHKGWDTAALEVMGTLEHHAVVGPQIVGTNDGHGRMTCFALVRRRFIELESGVFDRENTLYHAGYKSQYVDTEFAEYAKARGVWGEAPDAITEHLHHDFGKADPDEPNYRKAQQHLAADHARYLQREVQWKSAAM